MWLLWRREGWISKRFVRLLWSYNNWMWALLPKTAKNFPWRLTSSCTSSRTARKIKRRRREQKVFLKKWLLQQGWRWIEMSSSSSLQMKRPNLWQLCWCVASRHKLKSYSKNLRNKPSLLKIKLTWRSNRELVKKVHLTFCSQRHCRIFGTDLKKSLKE